MGAPRVVTWRATYPSLMPKMLTHIPLVMPSCEMWSRGNSELRVDVDGTVSEFGELRGQSRVDFGGKEWITKRQHVFVLFRQTVTARGVTHHAVHKVYGHALAILRKTVVLEGDDHVTVHLLEEIVPVTWLGTKDIKAAVRHKFYPFITDVDSRTSTTTTTCEGPRTRDTAIAQIIRM